ncbi:MAG: hypothetical protein ACI9AD_000771 [Nitriliruptoraceae bacterium]|jgi:hypothetical protein
MTLVAITLLLVALVGAGSGAAVIRVRRNRTRRNRVVPEVATKAPAAWAGTHTHEARLHRRLRDAVVAGRAVSDPDGSLIAARTELERSAVAVDEHLVALSKLSERERSTRMPAATAAVASVEAGAAQLSDARGHGADGALPAVAAALERAKLVAEARAELDRDPVGFVLGADAPRGGDRAITRINTSGAPLSSPRPVLEQAAEDDDRPEPDLEQGPEPDLEQGPEPEPMPG